MLTQTVDSYDNENNNNFNLNTNNNNNNNDKISSNSNNNKNSNKNVIKISNKNSSNNLNKISIKNSSKNINIISNQTSKKNSINNFNNNNNQKNRMPFNLNNNSIKNNIFNSNNNNFNTNSDNFINEEDNFNNNNNFSNNYSKNSNNNNYKNQIIENYSNDKKYYQERLTENITDDDKNEENNNLNNIKINKKIISGTNSNNIINNSNNNNNNNNDNDENEKEYDDLEEINNFSDKNSENNENNSNNDNNDEDITNENNEIIKQYKTQYIIESRKGYENLIDKNYLSAKANYLKCLEYSNTYLKKEKQKIIDSLINLSITEFYDAEFKKSLEYLNQAHNVYINTNFYDDKINSNILNELGIKLYTNFILANLSLNNYEDCIKNVNEIVKIIQTEIKNNNNEKARNYFKECVYTLFRVNTLKNSDSVLMDEFNFDENNNNNNINKKKIINHIMKGFQEFLKSKNYEILYNHFKEANDKYKEIEDKNGYYFTYFYQYVSLFELGKLNEKEIEQIKKQISICNKKFIGNENENLKEKNIEIVIKEFKEKSECAIKIFNILLNIENEIDNKIINNNNNSNFENESENLSQSKILDKSHLFTNEKISTPIFIKLLLKYSLNYLKKINKKKKNNEFITTLIKEIELLFDKIKKDLINIEIINLKFLDIEITQSLKNLFDNLILIYYKSKLKKSFFKFKQQINKQIKIENEILIQKFLEENLKKIENGFKLTKINFSSSGIKEHFYQIDSKSNNFCISKNENDKNKDTKNLNKEIIKIVYGFSSRNIKKKIIKEKDDIKELIKMPWKFLSIVLKERSIDLFMGNDKKNEIINYYFYGFYYYYQKKKQLFKINSCSFFVHLRTKFKLIWKLKQMYKNGKLKEKNENSLKLVQDIFNEKGIQKFSFIKLFLLFAQFKNEDFYEEENKNNEINNNEENEKIINEQINENVIENEEDNNINNSKISKKKKKK